MLVFFMYIFFFLKIVKIFLFLDGLFMFIGYENKIDIKDDIMVKKMIVVFFMVLVFFLVLIVCNIMCGVGEDILDGGNVIFGVVIKVQ